MLIAPVALELRPRQFRAPPEAEHELDHRHMLAQTTIPRRRRNGATSPDQ
jgi:hypothetical protein